MENRPNGLPSQEQARAALESVESMRGAAARQALGAGWLVAAGAVFIFLMALAPLMEGAARAGYIVTLCALWLVAVVLAVGRMPVRSKPVLRSTLLTSLTVFVSVAVVLAGWIFHVRLGLPWAPPAAGALAVTIYLTGFRAVHAVTRGAFVRERKS